MGAKSDVGFAVKKDIADKVESLHPWILAEAKEVLEHEAGKLYVFRDYLWNDDRECLYLHNGNEDVAKFVAWLVELYDDQDMFLLVEASRGYPEDITLGAWFDNPWDLHSRTITELRFKV